MRKCGECQLCCRLLPVRELKKLANKRCQHQRFRKGCSIYSERPISCQLWSCCWLIGRDTETLARPDKSHYVIDMMPDFVDVETDGVRHQVEVVQIWCDPRFREAHRDSELRAFIERRALEGIIALVRFNTRDDAIVLIAPCLMDNGKWLEQAGVCTVEHSAAEIVNTLGLKVELK